MKYRGVEFKVVQTLSPAAFKWVVKLDHAERSGTVRDRATAMRRAKQIIDQLVNKREHAGE
jgi:hypothetical protein